MWPMLGALRPLLGAPMGSMRDRDGRLQAWSSAPEARDMGELEHQPVAVLTGPRTASSGEAVVVAFRGRLDTRSFGLPTAGRSTSNSTFDLPDGSRLLLTTAVMIDRTGAAYGGRIAPDVRIDSAKTAEDGALAAAQAWLRGRKTCAPRR